MPYTVRSSERTRSSGTEYETKALLYLMLSEVYVDEFCELLSSLSINL